MVDNSCLKQEFIFIVVALHSLTMSDADTVLRKLLNEIFDKSFTDEELTLKPLTTSGANFTSALYSVIVKQKNEEPLKLFPKIANINAKLREVVPVCETNV